MDSADRDLDRWMPRLLAVARGLIKTTGPRDRLEHGETKQLGRAVERLSLGLTRNRQLIGQHYMDDPLLLAGYLLFYWPVSYAQIRSLIGEFRSVGGPILDLGSGPAPASFAALDAGAPRAIALDRSPAALRLAQQLAPSGRHLQTQRWSPGGSLPSGQFGLIVAQHLLNELGTGEDGLRQRTKLCKELLAKLSPGGTLLLVDPALRDTSRELLQVRDRLVADGVVIRAPCLYRGACQALDRPSDWCHAEREWRAPPMVLDLARAAGLRKERLKMSYLALASPQEGWAPPPPGKVLRIVSEPLQGKGRLRYMGCGPEGRRGLALQEKHLTEANRAFESLSRGEVIRIDGAEPRGDGLGLGPTSSVERLAAPGVAVPTEDGKAPRPPGSAP